MTSWRWMRCEVGPVGTKVFESEAALRLGRAGERRQIGQAQRLAHREGVRVVDEEPRLLAAGIAGEPLEPVAAEHAREARALRR